MKRLPILLFGLGLAACGSRESPQPRPGASLPPKSAMAARQATTDELLTVPAIARPDRVDELLTKSEVRPDDHFDLPPSSVATDSQTVPIDPARRDTPD